MDGVTIGQAKATTRLASPPAVTQQPRVLFLAALRGAALLYIVFDHTVAEIEPRVDPASPAWSAFVAGYDLIDQVTTGTRIPALYFLAGLFLERSIARGVWRFITTRLRTLVWPLLVWGLLQTVVFTYTPLRSATFDAWVGHGLSYFTAGLTTFDPTLALRGWWRLSGSLWFLDGLVIFLGLFLILRWLPKWLVLAFAAAWFVVSLVFAPVDGAGPAGAIVVNFGHYFLFFWLAVMTSDWAVRREARITGRQALLAGALTLAIAVPPVMLGRSDWPVFALVSGLPAIPLLLNASKWLARSPVRALVLWAGEASLLILCLHMLAVVLVLTLAIAAGITAPLLLLPLAFIGGLGLCLLAQYGLRRLRLSAVVGL
jgi:hypothetical protein